MLSLIGLAMIVAVWQYLCVDAFVWFCVVYSRLLCGLRRFLCLLLSCSVVGSSCCDIFLRCCVVWLRVCKVKRLLVCSGCPHVLVFSGGCGCVHVRAGGGEAIIREHFGRLGLTMCRTHLMLSLNFGCHFFRTLCLFVRCRACLLLGTVHSGDLCACPLASVV